MSSSGEVGEVIPSNTAEAPAETLERMLSFHKRFIHHPDESTHHLAVLWAAHTHAMRKWRSTPRLYITAPEPGCGKSTQAELLAFFSPTAIQTANMTAATLFRLIDAHSPTVFMDEADNQFANPSNQLTAVINDGYTKSGSTWRTERGVPTRYSVYCALALIGIENGTLPEATRTRCIPIQMRPLPAGAKVQGFDEHDHELFKEDIHERLDELGGKVERVDSPYEGRLNQLWSPLFSVAKAAGGKWPERVARAAEKHQWEKIVSEPKRILRATKDYFDEHPKAVKVTSAELADFVSAYDDLPAISPKALAKTMGGYGVRSRKSNGSMRYFKADLEQVWEQWL
jgi:hypothetical protein